MTIKQLGIDCKFSIHIPENRKTGTPDFHLVKEEVFYEEDNVKKSKSNLRLIKDYKRPFYITKENKRFNKEKTEWENLENLQEYSCTQSDLRDSIAKSLNKGWSNESIKQLNSSPYVYGADISSTSLLKRKYQEKYPEFRSKFSVCVFDVETDVLNGTEDIIMATIAFKDKLFTSIVKPFVSGYANVDERLHQSATKHIGSYLTKRNMTPEFHVAKDTGSVIKAIFSKLHEWMPDFLAIWNMNFDIPKVLQMLDKYNINPIDVLCDPSIPRELRICKYKLGSQKKITSSGNITPINPAEQWHTLVLTSSFYVIDAMCTYKRIRLGQQDETSYSLNSILDKELGIRKLEFKEAERYEALAWHKFMQMNYKIEYVIYNIFDCISMLELDDKTKDLGYTLPTYAGISDFSNFNKQPKLISDELELFCNKKGYAFATVGNINNDNNSQSIDADTGILTEPDTDDVLGLDGWIVALPAYNAMLGMNCILEDSTIKTGIRCHTYDSDAVGAYPTATGAANVSKSTTKKELISIEGVTEEMFRLQNLNFVIGKTNMLEYSSNMFNLPTATQMLNLI